MIDEPWKYDLQTAAMQDEKPEQKQPPNIDGRAPISSEFTLARGGHQLRYPLTVWATDGGAAGTARKMAREAATALGVELDWVIDHILPGEAYQIVEMSRDLRDEMRSCREHWERSFSNRCVEY